MHIITNRNKPKRGAVNNGKLNNQGFTLIEVMITVMIIAIVAAIAIPSYRRYVVMNAERDVQAKMLNLQLELERWRARALTYQGFVPQKISSGNTTPDYKYDEADNKTIYVPSGSTADNHRYQITLVDGEKPTQSLITDASNTTVDSNTGRSWKMLATPNSNVSNTGEHLFMLTSSGLRCQSKDDDIDIESANCGIGAEAW